MCRRRDRREKEWGKGGVREGESGFWVLGDKI